MKKSAELTYCGELVRKHDPDRFLVSLVMPPDRRPALWALFAFNYEIAKTREVVTETTLGHIRLQWWRDALAKIYEEDTALQNEILPELHGAVKTYDLPRDMFEALIYAREFDLENVPPSSLEGLENYADFTNTPLLRLALHVLGQEEDEKAIRNTAISYGLTGLLRAVPHHAAQGRSYMPADLMAEGDTYAAVRAVAQSASGRIEKMRPRHKLLKSMNKLPRLYLKQMKSLKFDLNDPRMTLPPPFFMFRFIMGPLK